MHAFPKNTKFFAHPVSNEESEKKTLKQQPHQSIEGPRLSKNSLPNRVLTRNNSGIKTILTRSRT